MIHNVKPHDATHKGGENDRHKERQEKPLHEADRKKRDRSTKTVTKQAGV